MLSLVVYLLKVQEYLQDHSLEDLRSEFGIKSRRHHDYQNLVSLKYGQVDSPLGEPIVQECRGIILDEEAEWRIISFPYTKFFNAHEGHAAAIDWDSATILEKLDGSLLQMFWYDDAWHVGTTGTPDGLSVMNPNYSTTFSDMFWKIFLDEQYRLPRPGYTYMFELCSMLNRQVVPYKEPKLILHGIRDLRTLKEIDPTFGLEYYWDVVKSYRMKGLDEILEACKELDPMKSEGYVVVDKNFNRVKVKSPRYVAMHHLKNEMTPRRMLEVVRNNETAELLAYFPEFEEKVKELCNAHRRLIEEINEKYSKLYCIEEQKEFALEATKERFAPILFMLRNGKIGSVEEGLQKIHTDSLQELLPKGI
jgi:T4 RnlA family RNA ligase